MTDYKYFTVGVGISPKNEHLKTQLLDLLDSGYEIVSCISNQSEVHYIICRTELSPSL